MKRIDIPICDLEELSFFIFNPNFYLKPEGDRFRTLSTTTCQYAILHALSKKKKRSSLEEIQRSIKDAFNLSPENEQLETALDRLTKKRLIKRKKDLLCLTKDAELLVNNFRDAGSKKYDRIKELSCKSIKESIREGSFADNIENLDEKIERFFDEAFQNILKEYLYETYAYFKREEKGKFYSKPLQLVASERGDPEFHQILEKIDFERILYPAIFSELSGILAPVIAIDWIGNKKLRKYLEEIRKSTWIFLDTNILISAICPNDTYNIPTNRILRYLRKLEFSFGVTPWTYSEFEGFLEVVRKRISDLATCSEDERMRYVNANILSPVTTFFRGNFTDSSSFLDWMRKKLYDILKDYNISLFSSEEEIEKYLDIKHEDLKVHVLGERREDIAEMLIDMGKQSFISRYDASNISLVRYKREKEGMSSIPYRHWIWSWDHTLKEYEKLMSELEEYHPTVFHGYLIATMVEPFNLLMEEKESKRTKINEVMDLLLSIPSWFRREGFDFLPKIDEKYESKEEIVNFQRIQHATFLLKNSGKKFIGYLTKTVKKVIE